MDKNKEIAKQKKKKERIDKRRERDFYQRPVPQPKDYNEIEY